MGRRFRFWLVYTIAWLPYAASYASLFATHLGRPLFGAIKESIFNVLPAALLGIGVVAVCQRLPWSSDHRRGFLSVHLVLSVVYATLWSEMSRLLYLVDQRFEYGSWSSERLAQNSLQRGFFTGIVIYVTVAGVVYAVQTTERLRAEEAGAALGCLRRLCCHSGRF